MSDELGVNERWALIYPDGFVDEPSRKKHTISDRCAENGLISIRITLIPSEELAAKERDYLSAMAVCYAVGEFLADRITREDLEGVYKQSMEEFNEQT
jgi:hypothetical protein